MPVPRLQISLGQQLIVGAVDGVPGQPERCRQRARRRQPGARLQAAVPGSPRASRRTTGGGSGSGSGPIDPEHQVHRRPRRPARRRSMPSRTRAAMVRASVRSLAPRCAHNTGRRSCGPSAWTEESPVQMRAETRAALAAVDTALELVRAAGRRRPGSPPGRARSGDGHRRRRRGRYPRQPARRVPGMDRRRRGAGRRGPDGDRPYWLVDPICGTRNFASNIPLYAVNIALVEDGAQRSRRSGMAVRASGSSPSTARAPIRSSATSRSASRRRTRRGS